MLKKDFEFETPADILRGMAETYEEKAKEYGERQYLHIGKMLEVMYPNGLTLKGADEFNRLHLFILMMVKISRYSQNFKRGGHQDSTHDLAVYTSMLEAFEDEKRIDKFANKGSEE